MSADPLDKIFSKTISHILETSEAIFGNHPQWDFYRKILLKRLNDLKREVEVSSERQGTGHASSHQK